MSLVKIGVYHHIKPHYKHIVTNDKPIEYSSNINPLNKEELKEFLITYELI